MPDKQEAPVAQSALTNDQTKILLADLLIRCRQLEIENAALQQALQEVIQRAASKSESAAKQQA